MSLDDNTQALQDLLNTVNELPNAVEVDDTLTESGKAADAKVVGDMLSVLSPIGHYLDFRGEWTAGTTYGADDKTTDMVLYDGNYYYLRLPTGSGELNATVSKKDTFTESEWVLFSGGGLPKVTEEDEGKILGVKNGVWSAVTLSDGSEVEY